MEVWRDIPSLPEYEASSFGRIMRRPWQAPMPNGGVRTYGGVPWLGIWEPREQRYIVQYRRKTYRVARLICEAFHGTAPDDRSVALHGDEDPRNNCPSNLRWGTQEENMNCPDFVRYAREAFPTKLAGGQPVNTRSVVPF